MDDPPAPAPPAALSDLLACTSLYDLSTEELSARLSALVNSASSGSVGLDSFLQLERHILLIHQELRERHLSAQLARDPWLDSELDDVHVGARAEQQAEMQQAAGELERQAREAAAAATHSIAAASTAAAPSASASASASAAEQQWANHADRRGLEEARRRAGGVHGPVRAAAGPSSSASAVSLPRKKPLASKSAAAGSSSSNLSSGSGSGFSIPESILNQRREMVIMSSAVDNRRVNKSPSVSKSKSQTASGNSPAPSPKSGSAASSARSSSRDDSASTLKRSSSTSSARSNASSSGGGGGDGAKQRRSTKKAAPELSSTQKAKLYAQEQRAATAAALAAKSAKQQQQQQQLGSAATTEPSSPTASTAALSERSLASELSSLDLSTAAADSTRASTAPTEMMHATQLSEGSTSPAPSQSDIDLQQQQEDEAALEVDGSYSSGDDSAGADADEPDGASADPAVAPAPRPPAHAFASMDHAAISAVLAQGDAAASALLRSGAAEPSDASKVRHSAAAAAAEGTLAADASVAHDGTAPSLSGRSRSHSRSRSRSPSPSPSPSASSAAGSSVGSASPRSPSPTQDHPLTAAEAAALLEPDASYRDAQLSEDEAFDDEAEAAPLEDEDDDEDGAAAVASSFRSRSEIAGANASQQPPSRRKAAIGGPAGSPAAAGAAAVSQAEWAKAAAAGDSVLLALKRKQARQQAKVAAASNQERNDAAAATGMDEKAQRRRDRAPAAAPPRVASDPRKEAEKALARHAKLREAEKTGNAAGAAAATTAQKKQQAGSSGQEPPSKSSSSNTTAPPPAALGKSRSQEKSRGLESAAAELDAASSDPSQASTAVVVAAAAAPKPPRKPVRPPFATHAYELFFPAGQIEYIFAALWAASTSGGGLLPGSATGLSGGGGGGGSSAGGGATASSGGTGMGSAWFSAMVSQMAQMEKFKMALCCAPSAGLGSGGTAVVSGAGRPPSASRLLSSLGSQAPKNKSNAANEVRLEYLSSSITSAGLGGGAPASSPSSGSGSGGSHSLAAATLKLSYADSKSLEQSRLMRAQRIHAQNVLLEAAAAAAAAAGGTPSAAPVLPALEATERDLEFDDDTTLARDHGPLGNSCASVFLVTREREEVWNVVRLALMGGGGGNDTQQKAGADSATTSAAAAPGAAAKPRVWVECPVEDAPKPDRLFPFLPPNFTTAVLGSAPSAATAQATPLYANPPSVVAAAAAAAAAAQAQAQSHAASPSPTSSSASSSASASPPPIEFTASGGQFHDLVASSAGSAADRASSLQSLQQTPSLYWNLLWSWRRPHLDWSRLLVFQRLNHFPDSKALTRKDLLKKNLERLGLHRGFKYRREWGEVMPQSFILPQEYQTFLEEFTRGAVRAETALGEALAKQQQQQRGGGDSSAAAASAASVKDDLSCCNYWIAKPPSLSRGRGIFVTNTLDDIDLGTPLIIQRYILNPLLLSGFKFDLRLYVLVSSIAPLEAFLYREGFARISTSKWSTSARDLKNKFIHLTNSSVQKNNILTREGKEIGGAGAVGREGARNAPSAAAAAAGENRTGDARFDRPAAAGASASGGAHSKQSLTDSVFHDPLGEGGSKISLAYLWTLLRAMGADVAALWDRIHRLVIKTLLAVEDEITPCVNSFELFGFDVLIDDAYMPHLIEVNASPSMGLETPLDLVIKPQLIRDIVALVNPLPMHRYFLSSLFERRFHSGMFERAAPKNREHKLRAMNEMMHHVLQGARPRLVGEMPANMGNFERLAPHTPAYDQIAKMKRTAFVPSTNVEHKYKRAMPHMA